MSGGLIDWRQDVVQLQNPRVGRAAGQYARATSHWHSYTRFLQHGEVGEKTRSHSFRAVIDGLEVYYWHQPTSKWGETYGKSRRIASGDTVSSDRM
jgi:hypothetical protein